MEERRDMHAAMEAAVSAISPSRLPRLLFEVGGEPDPRSDEPAPAQVDRACWLFLPGPEGYRIVACEPDEPPVRGGLIAHDGIEYRIAMLGPSPFRDGRPCAYLEPR